MIMRLFFQCFFFGLIYGVSSDLKYKWEFKISGDCVIEDGTMQVRWKLCV